jgi:hypothetical protein
MAVQSQTLNYPAHLRVLAEEAFAAETIVCFSLCVQNQSKGVNDINDLPPATRTRLSVLAISALSNDTDYARWRGLVMPENRRICDDLRAEWQVLGAKAKAAQRKLDAGIADWQANRDRWGKERFLPLPQGLSAWLMMQPPQVWHIWVGSLQNDPDLTPDLVAAINMVADHPACNRSTALRLLVATLSDWVRLGAPLAARIAARLERQDFTGPGFALPNPEWAFATGLLTPGRSGLTLSAAALGLRGSDTVTVDQPFEDGYPYLPYPEWRQQQGQTGT